MNTMSVEYVREMERISVKVAKAYRRKHSRTDVDDAAQQARLICVEVFQAGLFADVTTYGTLCYVAVNRQLSRYLTRQNSPVTCKSAADVKDLKACVSSDVQDDSRMVPHAERDITIEQLRQKIQARILSHFGNTDAAKIVAANLLDNTDMTLQAAQRGIGYRKVTQRMLTAVKYVKSDEVLRTLVSQLAEEREWGCAV